MLLDNPTNLSDSEFEDLVTEVSKLKREINEFEIRVLPYTPSTLEASHWHKIVNVKSIKSGIDKDYARGRMGAEFICDLRAGYFG